METEPNGPFAGLVSAIGLFVIFSAMIVVAVLVGVGFASWWAGVGIFVAMLVVLMWRVPSGPME